MYRKILILILSVISAGCLAFGLSACSGGESETYSTIEMEEGIVYFTDFSVKYTSEAESPYGDINENALSEEKSGTVQNYYMVMQFNMQTASNIADMEYLTVEFTVLDADIADATVNYANTSSTEEKTSGRQTTITATYSLPDKAMLVKNVYIVIELKPKTKGGTDITYSFSSETKELSDYEEYDTTITYSNHTITLSKTSLEYTLNDDGTGYTITGIGEKSGAVNVPGVYNGLPVTAIGNEAFYNCTALTSITIPDNITSIGSSAFYNCTALTQINFNATAMDDLSTGNVFYCAGQSGSGITVTIGANVTKIPADLFYPASISSRNFLPKITSVMFEDGSLCASIGNYAFYYCYSLTSITIPDSVTSIGDHAFDDCISLKSVTLGDGVKTIGNYTFYGCKSLTNIIIPKSVTSIGDRAFLSCSSLNSIVIDSGNEYYKSIDGNLYSYDRTEFIQYAIGKSNTSFTIPDSVTTIDEDAFRSCSSLTSITIPDSVTSIGKYTFHSCSSLTSITIPDSVTSIGGDAFSGCSSLTSITIPDSVTSIGSYAFSGCSSLTSITIPDSVTSIGSYAFEYCTSLKSITISGSVMSIGYYAFRNCTSLTDVTFKNTSGWYVSRSSSATSGTDVDVNDAKQNATYLTNTYYNYYWYRNES